LVPAPATGMIAFMLNTNVVHLRKTIQVETGRQRKDNLILCKLFNTNYVS